LEKLGFNAEVLHELNPGLIIGRVSGYGQTGPYASRPGFGTLAEGYSGYTYLNTQPDGIPTNPPLALADFVAGLVMAFAITMALRGQKRGESGGRVIDISLYEPLFSLFGPDFLTYSLTGEVPQPKGNELSYVVPRNNYRTKDGKWVALSTSAQKPFERLMEAIGHPEMNEDPRYNTNEERIKAPNRDVINRVITSWMASKNLEDIMRVSDDLGITVGPIATMEDIAKDRHYSERGSWIEIEDPVTKKVMKMPNVSFRILDVPNKIRFPGLPHGSANRVIFQDLLGYSIEEMAQLKAGKAI
jgi:crotonobetainyl-CoA:carnitine CoA-transferase CaiB-like acyl-CoA transferase